MCTNTHTHTNAHIHTHAQIYTCMHTHTCAHTHTHTHTHTQLCYGYYLVEVNDSMRYDVEIHFLLVDKFVETLKAAPRNKKGGWPINYRKPVAKNE